MLMRRSSISRKAGCKKVPRLRRPGEAHLRQHFGVDLRFADGAENARIEAVSAIVAGDEIHPLGQENLLELAAVAARHRRRCIVESLTGAGGHEHIAAAIANGVSGYG